MKKIIGYSIIAALVLLFIYSELCNDVPLKVILLALGVSILATGLIALAIYLIVD